MAEDKKYYLKQLKDIKFRKALQTYRKHKYETKGVFKRDDKYWQGMGFRKAKKVDPVETAALAYGLMRDGVERGDVPYSFLGAQLYEKIGKGEKAILRLLKTVKKSVGRGNELKASAYNEIESFVKRNSGEREKSTGSLEKKFAVFIVFIVGGLALSIGSLAITGNAVSNLTQTTPGLLGIILFIVGLVGMFFYFKGK